MQHDPGTTHNGRLDAAAEPTLLTAPRPWMWVSVAFAMAVGLGLRLWFLRTFPETNGDPAVYGDLAKNLLLHGQFALTDDSGQIHATLIRLPGYPLLMAACFRLFGMENYFAVCLVEIAMELAGCLLLADFVRRAIPAGWTRRSPQAGNAAALCALWMTMVCSFTASYAASPLTEAPTLFCIATARWAAIRFREEPVGAAGWRLALLFTVAVTYAALLRPDGALIAVAFVPALPTGENVRRLGGIKLTSMAAVCALLALAPFAAWTARNWRVFGVFQPLAPRYASDPGDSSDLGFQRWTKTWTLDFVSTVQIYWPVPGGEVDTSLLPARACDSAAQCAQTQALFAEYNSNGYHTSPEMDAGFAKLAEERIAANPLRFCVWLPLGRVVDMWLRPRVENLPIDLDWWNYKRHKPETRFAWAYAGANLIYVLLGLAGLCLRPKLWPCMVAYLVLRSALLSTVEGPEARYTLEFFPIFFAAGGMAMYRIVTWKPLAKRGPGVR
jgi:hypothetical protein